MQTILHVREKCRWHYESPHLKHMDSEDLFIKIYNHNQSYTYRKFISKTLNIIICNFCLFQYAITEKEAKFLRPRKDQEL